MFYLKLFHPPIHLLFLSQQPFSSVLFHSIQEEEEKKRATKELFEMEIQSDVAHPSGQKEAEAP